MLNARTDDALEAEEPLKETRVLTTLLRGAALLLALILLFMGGVGLSKYIGLVTPTAATDFVRPFGYLSVVLVLGFAAPLAAMSLLALAALTYLVGYDIPPMMLDAAAFFLAHAVTSLLLANRITRVYFSDLLQERPQLFFGCGLFFLGVFAQAFLLLSLQLFRPSILLATTLVWLGVMFILERAELSTMRARGALRRLVNQREAFLNFGIAAVLLVAALFYLYPGTLGGDSDKAYLAIAKFFARANSLFLSDPVVVTGMLRSFPYFQELYLSSGYLLDGNFGAKLAAWLVVCAKLYAIYFCANRLFHLSSIASRLLVLSYALMPVHVELHGIERPENMMTIYLLLLFYALERLFPIDSERSSAVFHRAFSAIAVAIVAASVLVSTKYTACFMFVALAIVYRRAVSFAIMNLWALLRTTWPVVLPAVAVALFWYLRNILLWGEVVSMRPYGAYHLTILFPPLRNFPDTWTFFTTALLDTARYTEYENFGYGFWGALVWPGMLIGLCASGVRRRAAAIVLLYTAALLLSTIQIRYVLPLVPFALLVIFSLFARTLSGLAALRSDALLFVFVFVQAAICVAVNYHGDLGYVWAERLNLQEKDLRRHEPLYAAINDAAKYPELILTSHFDGNYSVDARMVRADPLHSLADFFERLDQFRPDYLLAVSPDSDPSMFFFNDLGFLNEVAEPVVSRFHLHLFRPHTERLAALREYAEQRNWDLDKTYIISDSMRKRSPFTFIISDSFVLPGGAERLHQVAAMWWENRSWRYFGTSEHFRIGKMHAYYLQDIDTQSPGMRVEEYIDSLDTIVAQDMELLALPAVMQRPGAIRYTMSVPPSEQSEALVVEVFARIVAGSTTVLRRRLGEQAAVEHTLAPIFNLQEFELVDQFTLPAESFSATAPTSLQLEFVLAQPEARLRDIRVVLREPHQRLSELPRARAQLPAADVFDLTRPVQWISEDFKSALITSMGLRFATERLHVEAAPFQDFEEAMVLAAGKSSGKKTYRWRLSESANIAQVYLSGTVCGADSAAGLVLTAQPKVSSQREATAVSPCVMKELGPNTLRDTLSLVAECEFAAGAVKALELQLGLTASSGAVPCVAIDELVVLSGKKAGL